MSDKNCGIENNIAEDPLNDKSFRGPGFFEKLGEDLFGLRRPLDCIQIEVTSICPMHCVYCPHTTKSRHWKSRNMPDRVYAALWPCLRLASRAHLQGWGEPLLHPRFVDFVRFALKAGCQVSSTTSGIFINAEKAALIANCGLDMLAFSLVGTDRESNSARVGADFDKVCEGMKNLGQALRNADKSMEIHIAYLLLADRLEAVKKLPELMEKVGADTAVISTLDYLALPEQADLAYFPNESEKIARAREVLEDVALRAKNMGTVVHFSLPSPVEQHYPGGCRENIAKTLYVDADGAVSPCVYLNVPGNTRDEKTRVFGNVLDEDALTIWKRENFVAFRKNLVQGMPDKACENCPKRCEA